MKVVHLSYYYGQRNLSGAPMSATRLHQALLRHGIESHFVCVWKSENGVNVHDTPKNLFGKAVNYILTRSLWVLSKIVFGKIYMPNIIPLASFDRTIRTINPDIIHAHFIYQDMVSFRQILSSKLPLIISLHDFCCASTNAPLPINDQRFITGYSNANSTRVEAWIYRRKREFMLKARPLFTAPSDWAAKTFLNSHAGKDASVTNISNLIDPTFKYDKSLLQEHNHFVILFGANNAITDTNKGWSDLMSATKLLPISVKQNTVIKVFGSTGQDFISDGINITFAGEICCSSEMRRLHHAADIFAFPSRIETQGMTKMEALLDGLPVIAFNRAACAESITHCENGWIADDGDIAGYAKGIEYFYLKFKSGELDAMRGKIASDAAALFAEDKIVKQMIGVYEKALVGNRRQPLREL